MTEQLTRRPYASEDDFWRIRDFLRETFRLNGGRELSWPVYRWDYCRWHIIENITHARMEEVVLIWEAPDGSIAAVLNSEGRDEAFLQVHPAYRTLELEDKMLAIAEEHFASTTPDGTKKFSVWADEQDDMRRDVLVSRGYARGKWAEYQRRRSIALPIPETPVAEGYIVRALGEVDELPTRSYASWRAFHPDEPDSKYEGWEWYLNVQRAPLYRRDLDIVAVAPGDEVASFCTVWFDDVARTGAFEPVGTVPEHQRRGLGKAVMYEGLRRLKRLGATVAHVGSYGPEAHALYESAGFTEYDVSQQWVREF